MHTIFSDVYQTRRQRMHHIENPNGELVWSGKVFVEAIAWLLDKGIGKARLEGNDWSYVVTFRADRDVTAHPEPL